MGYEPPSPPLTRVVTWPASASSCRACPSGGRGSGRSGIAASGGAEAPRLSRSAAGSCEALGRVCTITTEWNKKPPRTEGKRGRPSSYTRSGSGSMERRAVIDRSRRRVPPHAPLQRLLHRGGHLERCLWQHPAGPAACERFSRLGCGRSALGRRAPLSLRPWRTCATQMLTSRRRRRATAAAIPIAEPETPDIGRAHLRRASGGASSVGDHAAHVVLRRQPHHKASRPSTRRGVRSRASKPCCGCARASALPAAGRCASRTGCSQSVSLFRSPRG